MSPSSPCGYFNTSTQGMFSPECLATYLLFDLPLYLEHTVSTALITVFWKYPVRVCVRLVLLFAFLHQL